MEKQVRWTEKFIKCKDLNEERGIDPTVINKSGFWDKPKPMDYDDQDKTANPNK